MKKLLIMLVCSIMLVACGSNEKPKQEQAKQEEQAKVEVEEDKKEESNVIGKPEKDETGTRTVVKLKKGLNIVKESGPFTITLKDAQIMNLETSESSKSLFDDKDRVTIVTLAVEVENKSKDTNTIHPAQGTMVTDTKEQSDAKIFLSDDVGGEFIGEVIKKGNVIFQLDSKAEDINAVKYIIGAPHSKNLDSLGEDIEFTIDFK